MGQKMHSILPVEVLQKGVLPLEVPGKNNLSKPWNRNPDLEVLFFPHLMLRFPPILAGV